MKMNIKERMQKSYDTMYCKDYVKAPSIKQMATYLRENHPELKVNMHETSCTKQTRPQGFRYYTGGGTRDYDGYVLNVKRPDGRLLFSHNTTDTHAHNASVARQILDYEKEVEK